MAKAPPPTLLARLTDTVISFFTSLITGVISRPPHTMQFSPGRKVYFANHSSHGDFMLVWIALPKRWRMFVRPVAGADYWNKGWMRRFLMHKVFRGLLIERQGEDPQAAIEQMSNAIKKHASLIIFPEGTRKTDDDVALQPFKSGIYYLAQHHPEIDFVPVWLESIHRVLPKGAFLPIPMQCDVHIGQPLRLMPEEGKKEFIARARNALLELAPSHHHE